MWEQEGFAPRYIQRRASVVMLLGLVGALAGCGGGGGTASSPLAIVAQPGNLTVPLGDRATFTVSASGNAPLRYQWSRDGSAIPGATGSTYTTSPVRLGDVGSTFQVTVSNMDGSIASRTAVLEVSPRDPAADDLRFQQVGAPSTRDGYSGYLSSNFNYGVQQSFSEASGSPALLGDVCGTDPSVYGCDWSFSTFLLPAGVTGLGIEYNADTLSNLGSDLSSWSPSTSVVTSIDLEPAHSVFAASVTTTELTQGFTLDTQTVSPANLQTTASQEGNLGRVITALSYDGSGNVIVLSYGWTEDTATLYESKVMTATLTTVGTTAAQLAHNGYIITAIGGNPSDGFLIIGTRVNGDSLPRPFQAVTGDDATEDAKLMKQGYAMIGYLFDQSSGEFTRLFEK